MSPNKTKKKRETRGNPLVLVLGGYMENGRGGFKRKGPFRTREKKKGTRVRKEGERTNWEDLGIGERIVGLTNTEGGKRHQLRTKEEHIVEKKEQV